MLLLCYLKGWLRGKCPKQVGQEAGESSHVAHGGFPRHGRERWHGELNGAGGEGRRGARFQRAHPHLPHASGQRSRARHNQHSDSTSPQPQRRGHPSLPWAGISAALPACFQPGCSLHKVNQKACTNARSRVWLCHAVPTCLPAGSAWRGRGQRRGGCGATSAPGAVSLPALAAPSSPHEFPGRTQQSSRGAQEQKDGFALWPLGSAHFWLGLPLCSCTVMSITGARQIPPAEGWWEASLTVELHQQKKVFAIVVCLLQGI